MSMGYIAYVATKVNMVLGSLFYAEGAWKLAILSYLGLVVMAHRRLSVMTEPPKAEQKKKIN